MTDVKWLAEKFRSQNYPGKNFNKLLTDIFNTIIAVFENLNAMYVVIHVNSLVKEIYHN